MSEHGFTQAAHEELDRATGINVSIADLESEIGGRLKTIEGYLAEDARAASQLSTLTGGKLAANSASLQIETPRLKFLEEDRLWLLKAQGMIRDMPEDARISLANLSPKTIFDTLSRRREAIRAEPYEEDRAAAQRAEAAAEEEHHRRDAARNARDFTDGIPISRLILIASVPTVGRRRIQVSPATLQPRVRTKRVNSKVRLRPPAIVAKTDDTLAPKPPSGGVHKALLDSPQPGSPKAGPVE